MNPSGIRPVEFKALIAPDEVEKVTKGGIIVPEQAQERQQYAATTGRIVAVSPFAFNYVSSEEWEASGQQKPKPGDKVLFAKFAGARVKGIDGKDYQLVNDKDIGSVIEE